MRTAWLVALGLSACGAGSGPLVTALPKKDGGAAGIVDGGPAFITDGGCPSNVPDPAPNASRFDDGGTPVDTRMVFAPARPPPPLSGGTLAVMADGTVVAADPDRDRVWLLGPTETTARSVSLQAGDEPGRVVEGPNGRAFVALRSAAQVAEIELATAQVKARHPACAAPRGMAWSPARAMLTVACATGALARLSFDVQASGLTLTGQALHHPAADLRDVVALPDGGMLVSTFRSAEVFSLADDGTATPLLERSLPFKGVAWRMVADPSGAMLVAQELAKPPEAGVCGSPSYGGFGVQPLVQSKLLLVRPEGVTAGYSLLPTLAIDLATSPSGKAFAVAGAGKNQLYVWRTTGNNQESFGLPGEPTSVAFRGEDTVFVFSREPARLFRVALGNQVSLAETVELGGESVRSTAHALFHRTTRAGIACASCHPEGGDDGHIWALPEGRRRTNSLRGGLKASAPFHWQGDRPTMRELLVDVMVRRMDAELPHPAAVTSMLDWVDAIPALPPPDGLDPAAVARGKALFEAPARGCVSCHSGPLGTNNTNANVGSGGSFQVPRLVDLAARAPYFHDGSVATLEARFATGGDLHGNVSTLTAAEIADLSEYLRSR